MSKAKRRTNSQETTETFAVAKKAKNNASASSVIDVEFKSVEEALKGIKKALQGLESQAGLSFDQILEWCRVRDISIPWPADLSPSTDFVESALAKELTFDFEAPRTVAIAGSFMLQTSLCDSDANVDLIVEQPEGVIFRYSDGAKDHINWRYWLRRTFYLVVCFDALRSAFPGSQVSFELLQGNPFKTIISFRAAGIDRIIRIIPSLPFSETFQSKMFRLSPQRSNVRPAWLQFWSHGGKLNHNDDTSKETPTTFYNYSLLSEALYLPHLVHLHAALKNPVLVSAIKMLKAWLKQTETSAITCMSGFLASMWLVDLVHEGLVNPDIMDELQIFKLVLRSWVDSFSQNSTEFCKKLQKFDSSFENVEGSKQSTVLLAGPMNLFYSANLNSLERLSQVAQATLSFISSHPDRLDRVFLSKVKFDLFTMDLVMEYKNVSVASIRKFLPAGVLQSYGNAVNSGYLEGRIALVLKKGLTDRIRGPIRIKASEADFRGSGVFDLRIGVTFDTLNSSRRLDLGPNSEDKEASAKFRGFWGSKSELRQFKDSAIRECVAWTEENVCREIISWLINRHFGIASVTSDTSKQLEFFSSESFGVFSASFDGLARELRSLNQILPLNIVQCVGLSPAHRHTALQVPQARSELSAEFPSSLLPSPSCPVYDFLIRFERSSAWPDERQALQTARQAFLLQLHRTLNSRKIIQASLVAPEYIDIFYNGFVFRGWIEVPREELRCRAEGLASEAERIERRNFWQTRLSSTLHQLASRHGAYPETCRLVKQFFSASFVSLDDDFIDVLVALVFLTDEDQRGSGKASWIGAMLQNCPAGTPFTGFLRFLDLLINFPWNERPLILDFTSLQSDSDDLAAASQIEIDAMNAADWSTLIRTSPATTAVSVIPVFSREQKAMLLNSLASPELSCLVPTLPLDLLDRVTLIRCKLMARLTLEKIETECPSSLEGFFRMSLEAICGDFDVLVKLDADQVQHGSNAKHHIDGLTRILRNAPQANRLLFSLLPGFSAPHRLVRDLSGPLKALKASIAYNSLNPVMLAVRVKDPEGIDGVIETIKRFGGDLIKDIKITRK
jgi:U3 small nucleolar RNA-associated protein 22